MAEPQDVRESPGLFETLRDDVSHVGAELKEGGWRRTVGGALSGLETFYLDEGRRDRLQQMSWVPRWVSRIWWLVRSLLMKLTRGRRVFFATALVLMLVGDSQINVGTWSVSVVSVPAIILIALLMLELKDKLIARQELEAGRVVQLALMPERSPAVPGWDLWLYNEPANDVGGDMVDHMRIDVLRHGVALGDVAGKALPAALLMVKLQATLRALAPQFESLGELGVAMNRILQRDGLPNRFATLVYIVLAEGSGEVRVLNAGHLPPLVVRGRAIERVTSGALPLGIIADATFVEDRVHLGEGDLLVAVSDGLTEATNAAGEDFGNDRLDAVVMAAAGQPTAVVGACILQALRGFAGDVRPHDDVSLLIVRRAAA